jgi:hypothetical protein
MYAILLQRLQEDHPLGEFEYKKLEDLKECEERREKLKQLGQEEQ